QTKGDLYLDASPPFVATGARLEGHGAWPYTVLRSTSSTGGVLFYNADDTNPKELMRVESDGRVVVDEPGMLTARTQYILQDSRRGSQNVIHNGTIQAPVDDAGDSASRIYYYNAETGDDASTLGGSQPGPPTTKYRAFTNGRFYDTSQLNINFDSQVNYHTG